MNETMEVLKDKATEAAQTAANATRRVAVITKKKLEILAEQEKIRRNYTRLGKIYYKDYVTDEEPDDAEYQPLCSQISASFQRINRLRDEISQIKEEAGCDSAGEEEAVEIVPFTAEDTAAE